MSEREKHQPVSAESFRDGDEVVFRVRDRYRQLGVAGLAGVALLGPLATYGMWLETVPERRLPAAILTLSFWAVWACIAGWMLLAYRRERLAIHRGGVSWQGVICRKEIALADVTSIQWMLVNSGGITLRTSGSRLKVHLVNFEPEERLWLIRWIRQSLPHSIQNGWELFCRTIALPLRDAHDGVEYRPGPDETRLTRSR